MKSIKIKLKHPNQIKINKLISIISGLELISRDYLVVRLKEIEVKVYLPFKGHYANYRKAYPHINSGVLQNHLRNLDKTIKSYIAWC